MAEPAHPPQPAEEAQPPQAAEHAVHAHPNYVRVWALLLALLCVSVIGPMIGIRVITIITAFGVAAYKAYLVAKNFMHINVEKPFISYLVLTVVVFMFLFFAGTAPDVMKPEGRQWEKPSWKEAPAPAPAHPSGPASGHASAHE